MSKSSFSYTSVPNSLRKFLRGVPNRGVPSKVDTNHLKSIGLKEQNDSSIIRVLKFVGLLNGDGSPSDAYRGFRDKGKGPVLLAKEIRQAYKELFETYPEAYSETDENLRNFFTGKTSLGKAAISFIVGTFKVLCEFADFAATSAVPDGTNTVVPTAAAAGVIAQPTATEIHLNLQIHLPDSTDPNTYDVIFAAINRHLGKLR